MPKDATSELSHKSTTVSFRLPVALAEELRIRAVLSGMSLGEIARKVVIDWLADDFQAKVMERLDRLESEAESIRDDIATGTLVLMVSAARLPRDEAEAWIHAKMPRGNR